jgi:hypothetical protein
MNKSEFYSSVTGANVRIGAMHMELTQDQFKDLMRSAVETMKADVPEEWVKFLELDSKEGK